MTGPSLINIILLYLSLMGFGAIGGYGIFYYLFSERCSQLMRETESKHSASRQDYQSRYEEALEGQRQCMAETSSKTQELQGRLEAQSDMAARHQSMLQKQEETLLRLSNVQAAHESATGTIASLREEVSILRNDLAETKRSLESNILNSQKVENDLRLQLDTANQVLEQRTVEVEELNKHTRECGALLPVYREEISWMHNYLRSRNNRQCQMEYGKGPFIVEFTLKFPPTMGPDEDPNTFQVELFPLSELPHTIFTFLDMVDLRLFDGTAFVAANGSRIEGGAPILTEQSSVKILERYSKYGYNHRSPLGFNEYSPQYPHVAFTIGFKGRHPAAGPALAINMMDNSEIRGPGDNRRGDPCFGKIISGFDTLQRIQKAPRAADRYRLALNVQIVSVRQLRSSPKKAADDAGSTTASV